MSQLELVPCPLCKETREFLPVTVPDHDEHISNYSGLYDGKTKSEWKACGRCGFVHQNPRPSSAALNEFYLRSQYHTAIKFNRRQLDAQQAGVYSADLRFIEKHIPDDCKSVFDVGCGYGYALKSFSGKGWETYGVEPDQGRSDYARKELGLAGVRQGILSSSFEPIKKIDLLYSHHAFEHIADLDDVMKGVTKVLRDGGYFFCAVPTYFKNRSNMSKLYLNSGHYSSFTHRSLMQLLSRFGFEEVAHTYRNDFGSAVTDDLLLLARYTGHPAKPETFYEDPAQVQKYVDVTNPMRSMAFSPIYAVGYKNLARTLKIPHMKLFLRDPKAFMPLVKQKLGLSRKP